MWFNVLGHNPTRKNKTKQQPTNKNKKKKRKKKNTLKTQQPPEKKKNHTQNNNKKITKNPKQKQTNIKNKKQTQNNKKLNKTYGLWYTSRGWLAGTSNSWMGLPWRIDPMTHHVMSERSYHGATSLKNYDQVHSQSSESHRPLWEVEVDWVRFT